MKKIQEKDKRPSYRTAPFESSKASEKARECLLNNFRFGWLFSAEQIKSISPNTVLWLAAIGSPEMGELLAADDGAWMHNLIEYINTGEPLPKQDIRKYTRGLSETIAKRFDQELTCT